MSATGDPSCGGSGAAAAPSSRPATAAPLAREAPKVVTGRGGRPGAGGRASPCRRRRRRGGRRASVRSAAGRAGRRWASRDDDDERAPGRGEQRRATARSSPSADAGGRGGRVERRQRRADAPRHGAGGDVGRPVELDDVGARDRDRQPRRRPAGPARAARRPERRQGAEARRGRGRSRRPSRRSAAPATAGRGVGQPRLGRASPASTAATMASTHASTRSRRRCRGRGSTGRRRRPAPRTTVAGMPAGPPIAAHVEGVGDDRRRRTQLAAQQVGEQAAAHGRRARRRAPGTSRWPGMTAPHAGGDRRPGTAPARGRAARSAGARRWAAPGASRRPTAPCPGKCLAHAATPAACRPADEGGAVCARHQVAGRRRTSARRSPGCPGRC